MTSARHLDKASPRVDGDRYRKIFNAMSDGFVLCEAIRDERGRLLDYWLREANPAFLRRTRAGRQVLDRRLTQVVSKVSPAWLQACDQVMRTGEPASFERWDPLSERWYEIHVTRISEEELAQVFVDITDRKRAEVFQSDLLTELNHRVKNNLAMVSGLLAMQARTAIQPDVRAQLRKAVDRIHAIADVHTALHRQTTKEEVDFGAYLKALCERIAGGLLEEGRVRLTTDILSATIPLEEAVPLGLIVNELVTNAAKHAYPSPIEGVVSVSFRSSAKELRLTVADHGQGVTRKRVAEAGGLGMRLVDSMVRHLGGELLHTSEAGACFEVRAPRGGVSRP